MPRFLSVPRILLAALLLFAALTSACGAEPETKEPPGAPSSPAAPSSAPEPVGSSPTATPAPAPRARPLRGIDASHHQGEIDWVKVRRDRIWFAYLKATEGSTFTDPRFVAHAKAAQQAGLRVGGYHYFSLCSPGTPQAEHFAGVLASAGARSLPPAIDLELLGNCADPPRPTCAR